ncbi:uncharacterized protein TRAVEDRAFT_53669 [Trametes versicolor FP-101664 SS1]|uniref:uncharacterized protein n=1 Tax=Trametes versicolor (strain FP-101664) TaxID=717944 RepID=UPI00046243D1|nr:uncharacterized protein TRAVEDRAFT_53669 [Trametes versicolor FP-101664 SS1]EIW52244.1 hypothetical protein TRAVEDRAFT_53669 [Trametes versicolor FP-101664 SS1]
MFVQLVKLRWTYIKDELTVMPLDDPARGICDIMGAKEHLIYRGDTFELANSVSSVLDVEEFSSQTVSLHVLGEDTRYSRKDLALFLPFGREKFSPLLDSWDRICRLFHCEHDGHYHPDTHILRWCTFCHTWYHIDCLDEVEAQGPTVLIPSPDRKERHDTQEVIESKFAAGRIRYDYHNFNLWQKLLKMPIQRGYPEYDYPLSFERLLLQMRKTYVTTGCPADVHNYVLEHLNLAPGLVHRSAEMTTVLYSLIGDPENDCTYYRCPSCEDEVII